MSFFVWKSNGGSNSEMYGKYHVRFTSASRVTYYNYNWSMLGEYM